MTVDHLNKQWHKWLKMSLASPPSQTNTQHKHQRRACIRATDSGYSEHEHGWVRRNGGGRKEEGGECEGEVRSTAGDL